MEEKLYIFTREELRRTLEAAIKEHNSRPTGRAYYTQRQTIEEDILDYIILNKRPQTVKEAVDLDLICGGDVDSSTVEECLLRILQNKEATNGKESKAQD